MQETSHLTQQDIPVGRGLSPQDLWRAIRANLALVLSVPLLAMGVAAAVVHFQPRIYQGEATMQIDHGQQSLSLHDIPSVVPSLGGGESSLQTDIALIRSRRIVESVADSLGLALSLEAPTGRRSRIFSSIALDRSAPPADYSLTWDGDGYRVEVERDGEIQSLPAKLRPGDRLEIRGGQITLAAALRIEPPQRIRFRILRLRDAVENTRDRIRVVGAPPGSQMIAISFQSQDPELAAAVPNAIAGRFIAFGLHTSRADVQTTVAFLRGQVASYEADLHTAEEHLRAFRERNKVISLTDEASEQVHRLAELQAQRDQLEVERDGLAKLLSQIGRATPKGASDHSQYRQLASFPSFFSNKAVQDILQSLTELENKRSDLTVRRTSTNVDVVAIDQRIRELETQLYEIAQNYLGSIDDKLTSVVSTLARFNVELRAVPSKEIEYARLMRQRQILDDLYKLLQTRLKEKELQEAIVVSDVRVLDPALVPEFPVAPQPIRTLGIAGVLGLLLGLGLVFSRRATDRRIQTEKELHLTARGLPLLGRVPIQRSHLGGSASSARHNGHPTTGAPPLFEAYRSLRTRILSMSPPSQPRVLVITSTDDGAATSSSAANLAISLARHGMRTVLMDTRLRGGHLHHLLGTTPTPGITELLTRETELARAVQQIDVGVGVPLSFLPAGESTNHPSELVSSRAMKDLVARQRTDFDFVVIDAAPLTVVDAAVLGQVADATILVVQIGVTDRTALQESIAVLEDLNVSVGGILLAAHESVTRNVFPFPIRLWRRQSVIS